MNEQSSSVNKKFVLAIFILLLIAGWIILPKKPAANFPVGSKEKFDYLSKQTSNSCGLQAEVLMSYEDEKYLQGSCCSSMVLLLNK